ncbi:MAG: hypothetical protein U0637_07455 [Phycisphaerales bacterium]
MSWVWTVITGVLCGAAGGGAGLFISDKCVHWYSVSSREGNSGYFMALMMLVGAVVGLLVGLVSGRVCAARWYSAFWAQGVVGLGAVVVLSLVVLGLCRFGADVEPTYRGRCMDIEVEVRGPEGVAEAAGWKKDEAWIAFASVQGGVQRFEQRGEFLEGAPRSEEGRWFIRGKVPLRSERGMRVVRFKVGEVEEAFGVSVPAWPEPAEAWSEWLPRARPDGKAPVNRTMYRFRVVERAG